MDKSSEFDRTYLLEKRFTCPICSEQFKYVQTKSVVFKVEKRNTDLYVEYKGINPSYYEAVMCEKCGFAAFSNDFDEVGPTDKKRIEEYICSGYKSINLPKEKTLKDVLTLFEQVYNNYSIRSSKSAELARCSLRLMWFFNEAGRFRDADAYCKKALDYYIEADSEGAYDLDSKKAVVAYYLIGELSRLQGKNEDAYKWYRKALQVNNKVNNSVIQRFAEDQMALLTKKDK